MPDDGGAWKVSAALYFRPPALGGGCSATLSRCLVAASGTAASVGFLG